MIAQCRTRRGQIDEAREMRKVLLWSVVAAALSAFGLSGFGGATFPDSAPDYRPSAEAPGITSLS